MFEIEIERNNVTVSEFLSYVRRTVDKKGGAMLRSDLGLQYFRRGDDLNFSIDHKRANDECFQSGCENEKSVSHPYEMQTYIRWANGSLYNEICEFEFDNENRGHGYYYLISKDGSGYEN